MSKKRKSAISPTRAEDYPEWYQQVVRAAELAETSPVRGCMVIKPWGYALWENIQQILNEKFKATGHKNAYFPLFIPLSFLQKEAEHVEGFAKECAVVTHRRLEAGPDGSLVPAGELEEPLIVRPTSETVIGAVYAKWVESYRDLPLLINQWANVVRWEMRPRLFLRTAEFLWQEGHTVHATEAEAMEETRMILDLYADFMEGYMAMPVIKGEKTADERFPGAVSTFSVEAMMQDGKALQAGTSHFLGQNFAKASEIMFLDQTGQRQYAWTTSWGVSTRLIGGLLMTHADDDGLVLPPKLAPQHVAIVPILRGDDQKAEVLAFADRIAAEAGKLSFDGRPVRAEVDARDVRGPEKIWSWVKKGVPIRVEVGPREVEAGGVSAVRRDRGPKERQNVSLDEFLQTLPETLGEIQDGLLERARAFRDQHTREIASKDEFYEFFNTTDEQAPQVQGGFALCGWSGEPEISQAIKKDLNVTVRCISLEGQDDAGECIFTGKPAVNRAVFARSY